MKLFNTIRVAGVVSGLLITAAWANTMDARYDNTVTATSTSGTVTRLYYNRDNTLAAVTTKEGITTASRGTWRQDGTNVCVTPEATFFPFIGGKESCVPLQGDKIGDSWEGTAADAQGVAQTSTFTIVAGR